jgi:hypothetical protein
VEANLEENRGATVTVLSFQTPRNLGFVLERTLYFDSRTPHVQRSTVTTERSTD